MSHFNEFIPVAVSDQSFFISDWNQSERSSFRRVYEIMHKDWFG